MAENVCVLSLPDGAVYELTIEQGRRAVAAALSSSHDYAALKVENERLKLSASAWEDSARINKARADEAERALAERAGGVKVDALAQEIRRVDGSHSLGAGALAEALMPFLSTITTEPAAPEGRQEAVAGGYFIQERDDDMLICAKHWQFGSICIARRPKLASNDEWRSTAQEIVAALTRPAEQAVTEAARRVLEWVYPIAGDNRDEAKAKEEIESVEALKAAMEAGR